VWQVAHFTVQHVIMLVCREGADHLGSIYFEASEGDHLLDPAVVVGSIPDAYAT
jgi:hypothetical protein